MPDVNLLVARLAALMMVMGSIIHSASAADRIETRASEIAKKLRDPTAGLFIIAHRGCHNPAPALGLPGAPENSLPGLEHCIRLGVDMVELDVRKCKDGALVVMHDATVDRTTEGRGLVADLTLSEIRALHLRDNLGGEMSPMLTDQGIPTLEEFLVAAKGRIMLNLDIKEDIHSEVIAAVEKFGVSAEVLVKATINRVSPPLSDQMPYRAVPFMPVIYGPGIKSSVEDLVKLVGAQTTGRRRIPAVEMVYLNQSQFQAVRQAAKAAAIRLWTNTLSQVGVTGVVSQGADIEALRDKGLTWGRIIDAGVSAIQTDEPAYLMDYMRRRGSTD